MIKQDHGRFCNSCEKTVADFSKMSEEEISTFLKKSQEEHLCIRVKSYQLEENSRAEKFLLKLRKTVSQHVSFTPLRIALITMITSLLTFTSCYIMGKKMDVPIHAYKPNADSTKTKKEKSN
jgi:hypothetical protein